MLNQVDYAFSLAVRIGFLVFVVTACTVQPEPSAMLSPLRMPISPLASPAMEQQAILLNLMVADAPVEPGLACGLNASADMMATLLAGAEWQERDVLVCDYRLVYAAQSKAEAMAKGNWFAHDDPTTGETPNELIRRFGCQHDYGRGNSVESLVAGSPDASLSLAWLLQSPAHRRHLAGDGWFERQSKYGVGYAANPHVGYGHYFTIITAECLD